MRRIDREIKDMDKIIEILDNAKVIRISMFDDIYPYIVPLCFGYEIINDEINIYFHSANEGLKLDLLKKNNHIAFEVDKFVKTEIMHYGITARYRSVIGFGNASFIDNDIDKKHALDLIVKHYGYKDYNLDNCKTFNFTQVIKITVKEIHGKKNIE